VALVAIFVLAHAYTAPDRVHLRDIPSLVFAQGAETTSRRGKHYPQMVRTGGSAPMGAERELATALCTNMGFDGRAVNWRCESSLPDTLALGAFEIVCEGYDGPNDDHSLRGSCSLEYELNARGPPPPPPPSAEHGVHGSDGVAEAHGIRVSPGFEGSIKIMQEPGITVKKEYVGGRVRLGTWNGMEADRLAAEYKAAHGIPVPKERSLFETIRDIFAWLWASIVAVCVFVGTGTLIGLCVLLLIVLIITSDPHGNPSLRGHPYWGPYWHRLHHSPSPNVVYHDTVNTTTTHIHAAPAPASAPSRSDYSVTPPPSSYASFSFGTSKNRGSSSSSSGWGSSSSSSSSSSSKPSSSSKSTSYGSSRNR
jgi:hypothetical protein